MPIAVIKYLAIIVTLTDALEADVRRISAETVDGPASLFQSDDPEFAAKTYGELSRIYGDWIAAIKRFGTLVRGAYKAARADGES